MLPISTFVLLALFLLEEEPVIVDPVEELGKAVWGQLVPQSGQELQQQERDGGVRVGAAAEQVMGPGAQHTTGTPGPTPSWCWW